MDNIDVLVTAGSNITNAVSPITEKNKVLIVSYANAPDVTIGKNYVFTPVVSAADEVDAFITEMKKRGYKKIGIATSIQDWAMAVREDFKGKVAEMDDVEILLDETFMMEHKDFKTFFAKAKSLELDAFVNILVSGHLGVFGRQSAEAGMNDIPMPGFELYEDRNEIEVSNNVLVGQWYVNANDADPVFMNRYKDEFGIELTIGAPSVYDYVSMVGDAVDACGDDVDCMAEFMKDMKDRKGYAGIYTYNTPGHFHMPAVVKIVTETSFENLYK